MDISDLIRIKKELVKEYELKFKEALKQYVEENSKFKIGDIVIIKSRGDFGIVESFSIDEKDIYYCEAYGGQLQTIIRYKIRMLTKKLQPRKDNMVMTWGEDGLELKTK